MNIVVDNYKVNIRTGGYDVNKNKKPTLLLIHGAGMDGTVWQMQTRYLSNKGINALAVDLPGHGASEGSPLKSISEMSNWVIKLLDILSIDSVVIAGHSMGSLIAIETAKNDKNKVQNIILMGTASIMPVHPDLITAAKNNLSIAANLITDWSLGKTQHIGNNPSPGSWMIGSSIQLIMNSSKGVLAQDLIACNEYLDAPNSAKDINQEVLIISGKEDKMTPAKKAKELSNIFKKSRMVVIEDAGHMMMMEQPIKVTQLIYKQFR